MFFKALKILRSVSCLILLIIPYCISAEEKHPAYRSTQKYFSNLAVSIDAIESIISTDPNTCIIPFTLAGKLILVQGRADSMQGNFIFDTGSPDLVLNATYFREYRVTAAHDETESSITGEGRNTNRTIIGLFTFGTLNYPNKKVDLVNLGHIEDSRQVKILGLLGVELFKECEVMVDFKNRVIRLHRFSKKDRKQQSSTLIADQGKYSEFPFEIRESRILLKTKVATKELQFVVDFGAESNVIDSRLPQKVLDAVAVTGRVLLSGTGNKKIEAVTGNIASFSFADRPDMTLPVIITNLENTCFGSLLCINGVLGHDFLSGYTFVFNFVKRKLYILNEDSVE
jgi:hypothetical protein